jgi:hypothetical protein
MRSRTRESRCPKWRRRDPSVDRGRSGPSGQLDDADVVSSGEAPLDGD